MRWLAWVRWCGVSGFAVLLLASVGAMQEAPQTVREAPASDWPTFRGNPQQTGYVEAALPDKLEIRWKFKTSDAIEGAAAIVQGVVYVGSFDQHLYAIDLASGTQKWKTKLGPIKAAPGVREGVVYVGDVDGKFYAVAADSGKLLWQFATEGEITSGCNFSKEGLILVGSHDQNLYAIDRSGKAVWQFRTEGPVNGSPAVVGNRTFIAGCDSILHVLDTTSGKEVAAIDLEGQAGASAAVDGDRLYVGTMNNQVLGIDWKQKKVVWTFEARKRQQPFYSSAAVTKDLIVVGSRDKRLYALQRTTGREAWSLLTEGRVDASPVVVGNRVYVGSLGDEGMFYSLDLTTGAIVQKWSLDGAVTGSAAVGGGVLVVGTEKGTLYCFGK